MEVLWHGSGNAPGSDPKATPVFDARTAIFLTFKDGRIAHQRTYACFEPWSTESERSLVMSQRAALSVPAAERRAPRPARRPPVEGSNFQIARGLVAAWNEGASADEVATFYADDVVVETSPNRPLPGGSTMDIDGLHAARRAAQERWSEEHYDLRGATGGGGLVAMEFLWTGSPRTEHPPFAAGERVKGRVAMFLHFRDGLIVRQRNYVCV
jgi:ketosteroid isomerase-like protein